MPGICPRCSKNVYFAEEVKGLGQSWHKLCFTCQSCRKMLSAGSISEHDNQVFCNACYRKNYGPKGYGYGVGSGTLSMDDGKGYITNPNEVDHKAQAYVAPKKPLVVSNSENKTNGSAEIIIVEKNPGPFRLSSTEPTTGSYVRSNAVRTSYIGSGAASLSSPEGPPSFSIASYGRGGSNSMGYNGYQDAALNGGQYVRSAASLGSPDGVAQNDKPKPKWGGAEKCPRCDKSVFIAELMRAAGRAWHKSCFTCQLCNKRVDSNTLCEREGEIYCKSCYGRNFGPKGVGFGIGAGTLTTS